jgi:hypothetical protein
MKKTLSFWVVLTIVLLSIPAIAKIKIQYDWQSETGEILLDLRGTIGAMQGSFFKDSSITSGITTFDWGTPPSISYDMLRLSHPGGNLEFSNNFTAGPGVSKEITATIFIDPISIGVKPFWPIPLKPYVNNKYVYEGGSFDGGEPGGVPFDNLKFSGSYKLVGPSQSATGTFSLEIPPDFAAFYYAEIDTTSYPSYILMESSGVSVSYDTKKSQQGINSSIVNTVVDGVRIDVYLDHATCVFLMGTTLIPEPSTFMFLGLSGLALLRRRRTN